MFLKHMSSFVRLCHPQLRFLSVCFFFYAPGLKGLSGASSNRIVRLSVIGLSPNPGHSALHVLFLTSFYCDVTIAHPFDGPFTCDVTMEKSANRCDVGPLAIRQFCPTFKQSAILKV